MACDCEDENNINSIPVGPAGPTGPTGPAGNTGPVPTLTGASLSNVTVGLGMTDFTLTGDTNFNVGQRVSVVSTDLTKSMDGVISAYSTVTDIMTVDVDTIVGSGNENDWTINLSGTKGATGATGATGAAGSAGATGSSAFTTLSGNAVSLGGTSYRILLTDRTFVINDMILFIKDAGYYQVTDSTGGGVPTAVIVTDLQYTGNTPANLLTGKTVTPAGLQGDAGTAGTDGFNYETVDGNNIPAEATSSYQFLMRNSDDTGYTWTSLSDLKALLALIP